ncbi:MAG: hypothetical protein ACRYGP_17415 [Janthinobacterium lividum]
MCDKPTTVAVSRLSLDRSGRHRLPPEEFTAVLALVLRRFPALAPHSA